MIHFMQIRQSLRRLSGGAAKPHWGEPPKHRWQPFLPDRHYYGEHATYNGFVLLLRGLRPRIERICSATFKTATDIVSVLYRPIARSILKHNPDIRYQLVALTAFFCTTRAITLHYGKLYQGIVDLRNLLQLGVADDLNEHGFWNSAKEDKDERIKYFEKEQNRLNKLWENSFKRALFTQKFEDLCKDVIPTADEVNTGVLPPVSWRFNMIPYGKDNEDAVVFDTAAHDMPLRSMALNFTYNNLSGDWGDYIDRQDNKSALLRPSRQMFTDIYIPGTK
ncbi:uncharacterized protein BXIN_0731 [Babesia sp. Xinjiang]|uniref:uncharacterized protein n=1 Tax=Babesia sp. Xinjiang TaxID=462227 RepID=UPI000A2440F3|nr:uncharacterized protein BXIN_0668 [Babesia sp. Xinjiang]XP_028872618.1 uncharacterized protein BXIN_0731 [Babesia sp. Xinjiang]ORM42115.1 hypothetical protein BXIN_0668 [Babesia sp. Xinjiang]ORM42162.1 hypothetical protein BXIN_0731 [Babesia sp. Xinjiang]